MENFVDDALPVANSVEARAGDIVVFETLDVRGSAGTSSSSCSLPPFQWLWSIGEVIRQPTTRVTEVRLWRRKEKLIDMTERLKKDKLRSEIAKKKEELELEKELVLGDQNSIAAKRMRVKQKVMAAENKIAAARESMAEAQRLVSAITDKQWAEVRGYSSPPPTVRLVLEAVLLLLNISFRPGDWLEVRERVREKDFIRQVSMYSQAFLSSSSSSDTMTQMMMGAANAMATVESQYLPVLTVEKVRHSSKAAVALHAWISSTCYALGALREMARVQEEIVLLDFAIEELGEEGDANTAKMRAIEKDVRRLEAELERLYAEVEEADDMFLMTTVLNTARGGAAEAIGHKTISDLTSLLNGNNKSESEFYATLETQYILTSQIFANLEHDVVRGEECVSSDTAVAAALVTSRRTADGHRDSTTAAATDSQLLFAQTLRIDPMKVLMTARGGPSSSANQASAAALFGAAAVLPANFKLSTPPTTK